MTTLLPPPSTRVRSRKDLSASNLPTLVSLEEEQNYSPPRLTVNGNGTTPDVRKYSDSSLPSAIAFAKESVTEKPSKASRRSSLGLGLLSGKSSNDSNKREKRRSSIAVVFLGRRNSKVRRKARHRELDMLRDFRNFTVEGADDREGGEVSTKII